MDSITGSWNVGSPTAARQLLWIGRSQSTSAPVVTGANTGGDDVYVRMYEFTDCSTGTTFAEVVEGGPLGAVGTAPAPSLTDVPSPPQTLTVWRSTSSRSTTTTSSSTSPGRRAGTGRWRRPTRRAPGTDGAIGLQTAAMATAGTIDGGTFSMDSDAWGVVGFALIGTTVVDTTYYPRHPAHDFGSITPN